MQKCFDSYSRQFCAHVSYFGRFDLKFGYSQNLTIISTLTLQNFSFKINCNVRILSSKCRCFPILCIIASIFGSWKHDRLADMSSQLSSECKANISHDNTSVMCKFCYLCTIVTIRRKINFICFGSICVSEFCDHVYIYAQFCLL